ncbi:MAG: glycoside hydrolase family 127 protein, partial [Candidatus Aminicenantes bacterium]|nr:glycoside hydrolase family 127 protein [Candidatus Aminicenantes bacterium]
ATGKRTLLDIAIKNADLIDTVFGLDKKIGVPGHQEIEIGLVKLYRVTGNKKYLDLAKFFLDERGHPHERELYGEYSQDHKPVIEQTEPVGHAVRAAYMYSGMADVAALTGDEYYRKALETLWDNVASKKMYITGGIGSRSGGESFGSDYELPNASAYCETCAAIANAFWNHRMFLLSGDSKYIDVLERVLYNGILSGIALSGDLFFYPNPLESHGQHKRSPWFTCACCPSNVTRFVPSVPGYAYATQGDALFVNLFVQSSAEIQMGGQVVQIEQETAYPWEGSVKITVAPEKSKRFTLFVRIPGWARNQPVPSDLYRYMDRSEQKAEIRINGEPVDYTLEKGYARLSRKWEKGDTIEFIMPMPIRRVLSHENVKENAGRVALERGPVVYCAEWLDNQGYVSNLVFEDTIQLKPEKRDDLFNGVIVLKGEITVLKYADDGKTPIKAKQEFMAIPYYAWAHRGEGEMAVWLQSGVMRN